MDRCGRSATSLVTASTRTWPTTRPESSPTPSPGSGDRRFDDVVVPACVFTDPPVITIGPTPAELGDTVLWESASLSEVPRASTDEYGDGYLTIGVDRSTRRLVAAHGVGANFDVLAAALVTAIDAEVPVDQLARSMWPFPTVGELLGVVYSRASASLD